jgi:hypothetical protein
MVIGHTYLMEVFRIETEFFVCVTNSISHNAPGPVGGGYLDLLRLPEAHPMRKWSFPETPWHCCPMYCADLHEPPVERIGRSHCMNDARSLFAGNPKEE